MFSVCFVSLFLVSRVKDGDTIVCWLVQYLLWILVYRPEEEKRKNFQVENVFTLAVFALVHVHGWKRRISFTQPVIPIEYLRECWYYILYIKMKRFQMMYPIEKMDRSSEKTRVGDEMGLLWYWSLWCGRVDYGHSLVWEQRYEKRWDAITTRMMMMMLIILMIVCA